MEHCLDITLSLPDELLSKVIRKLTKTKWLCAAVLVNRRWHGLAVYWRLWRAHYLARFPSSPPPPSRASSSWPLPPLLPPAPLPLSVSPPAQHDRHPPGSVGGSALCAIADCGQTDASRAWCTGTYGSYRHGRHCEGSGANGVPAITMTGAVGARGRVVEWRDELVSNARRVHERWMTNQKRLLWSYDVPYQYKFARGSSQVAPRDGKVCFARIAIASYQVSYVLVLYVDGKRDWRTLSTAPRALCWPSDDALFLLHESQLTLMDVRTRGDIKSVAVDSTRQFELLSVDPKNQLACMAGPLGLSCVDHRVGAQVGRVGWDADPSIHFMSLGGETNPYQLCVVGHRRAALWDTRKLGQQLDCVEPAHAATEYRCAALHDGTLLLSETTAQTHHTFRSFELEGGLLAPSAPFPQHHFLSQTLVGAAQAPFRIQFDRYKCVLGLGNEWAVVDRRTGCVSEGFPFAAQAAAKCSGGGPYDLAYHNDTLVTATSSHLMLWDYFTEPAAAGADLA